MVLCAGGGGPILPRHLWPTTSTVALSGILIVPRMDGDSPPPGTTRRFECGTRRTCTKCAFFEAMTMQFIPSRSRLTVGGLPAEVRAEPSNYGILIVPAVPEEPR